MRRLSVQEASMARSAQGDRRQCTTSPGHAAHLTPGSDVVHPKLARPHCFLWARGWCPPMTAADADCLRQHGRRERWTTNKRHPPSYFYAVEDTTPCSPCPFSPGRPRFLALGEPPSPRALPAVTRGIPRRLASPLSRVIPLLTRLSPFAFYGATSTFLR